MLRFRWKGKPVRVERLYADGLPMVPLDESLCEQAFLNLVQNAYEAMEEHGGTLRVEARLATVNGREGVQVVLRIVVREFRTSCERRFSILL